MFQSRLCWCQREHRAVEAAVVATALARGEAQGASRKAQGTVLRILGGHGGPRHREQSRLPCFAAVKLACWACWRAHSTLLFGWGAKPRANSKPRANYAHRQKPSLCSSMAPIWDRARG